MDRPIPVPFIIIEFGQLEETVGEQLEEKMVAGVQPRWIQGIRSGDGVGEDQETIA